MTNKAMKVKQTLSDEAIEKIMTTKLKKKQSNTCWFNLLK